MLGHRQSGHMEAVGYDMYCKMLNEAIRRKQGVEDIPDSSVSVELDVDAFIPEGRWYDIFTGMIYEGKGRKRKLYRTIDSIPVLLKAGGIVPESVEDTTNGTDNPSSLRILYGAGESGEYTIYEDDGVSMDYCSGKYVTTRLSVNWNKDSCEFAVDAAQG